MTHKIRRFLDSSKTPAFLYLISMYLFIIGQYKKLGLFLMTICIILDLRIDAKQPLPLWGDKEIKRWERVRAGGERQFMLAPALVIPAFLIIYVFLLINAIAVWEHALSSGLLAFDALYGAIALVLLSLIYLTRKGLWSLREKRYKALLGGKRAV